MNTTAAGRGRGRLLLLAGLFVAPMLLAAWLYGLTGWRPPGSVSRGELIQPPRPLPLAGLPMAGGGQTPAGFLRGAWTLLYIGDGSCDPDCRQRLASLQQVRRALDKDASRLRRVFLYHGACCDDAWLRGEQAGLLAASLDDPGATALQVELVAAGVVIGGTYIVDPLGNLMMAYAAGTPANSMLKDLERLLRLSQIG